MSGLTTHVLDTSTGRPGVGIRIELFELADDGTRRRLLDTRTNDDGRTDAPLLGAERMAIGRYEIVFHLAEYFRERGVELADPPFLDTVPVRFSVSELDRHYHVPLLAAPFGYSTYRGS